MTKLLCKPCAVDLAARGKTVKPVAQRCEKITCSECGRRRFGITYEVTGRATRKKEVTFQSTPSARRATVEGLRERGMVEISIHALREEGDTNPC